MSDQKLWYLENFDTAAVFCPQKVGNVMDTHVKKVFKKGEYVYIPNEHSDKIYFIDKGSVKIGSTNEDGKEITKAILNDGEVFGELSIIGHHTKKDFAQCLEETEICIMSSADLKNLVKDHSAINLFFLKIMGSRILEIENRLESLVFKDSRSRIVEFLLNLVAKKGERVGYEMVVRKFMTHQQIASLTATSRQTVTTVLNDLRNKNILTFDRRRLLVRDMDLLKEELKNIPV